MMENGSKLLLPLIAVWILSCKEKAKQDNQQTVLPSHITENTIENKENTSHTEPIAQDTLNSYFTYKKWNIVHKSNETYEIPGFVIYLKSYLNEANNIGGKKVFINNKEIDFIITDAYVFTPFIFVDGTEKILLLQEEDESGVYGYRFYYFNKDELIKKEYLEIAPENILKIDKFIKIKNEAKNIKINILTNKYYDTKLDEMKSSAGYSFIISKAAQSEKSL